MQLELQTVHGNVALYGATSGNFDILILKVVRHLYDQGGLLIFF